MKKNLVAFLLVFSLPIFFFGCGGGGNSSPVQNPVTTVVADAYTTSITPITNKSISASQGGLVEVTDASSSLKGLKLTIPKGALSHDTTIKVGEVNNPPVLPLGLNYVGTPIDFGPDGTTFSTPATIEIPFTDLIMDQAGVTSKTSLKLYAFDKTKNVWSEIKILSIDTVNNVVTAQVEHFSFYSIVGLSGTPPDDLGKPLPGDMLFTLSSYDSGWSSGWVPGHSGIYTGEKNWNKDGKASADVKRCGKYNVVEALLDGVQYSYYKIPNTEQSCKTETLFSDKSVYMGARESRYFSLSFQQRMEIVSFVEDQSGKPYVTGKTLLGFLDGIFVKGPDKFNCVGLVEKAYELAGVNGGQGILMNDDWRLLTPAEQYSNTKPAGGVYVGPIINWAKLTPSSGTTSTQILAQISVSHPNGLGFIDSVRYQTDSGYVNPNININDKGVAGDIKADDGVYTSIGMAGQDATSSKNMGLTFIVTDKNGKSASIRLVYTYTNAKEIAKSLDEQLLRPSESWGQ